MTDSAWYLRCPPDDIADRAVIVGDQGRVTLAAEHLGEVVRVNEDRGLMTITGTRAGQRVTVAAFGMGAPVAAIVVDELVRLGARMIVRLGTAMTVPPVGLGDLVVAEAAVREESTSATYVPAGYPASADAALTTALADRSRTTGRATHEGLIASYDGFYTEMVPDGEGRPRRSRPPGVLAVDMETSAVLTVGRARGARAGSLCLATVDGTSAEAMPAGARTAAEHDLLAVGLDVVAGAIPAADLPDDEEALQP